MKKIFPLFITALLSSNLIAADEWKIKEDGVAISIEDNKFKGSFENLSGTIIFSPDDLENSSFEVSINTEEIKVDGSSMQERHVKDDKWLGVEKYPAITFKSTSIEKTEEGYIAKGTMTIHGVSKEVEIPFTFEQEESVAIFEGEISISRKNYDVGPDGNTVEEVTVSIQVITEQ